VLQVQSGGAWPAQAVRDTVAAIAREDAYQRSLGTSLWRRIWQTVSGWLDALFARFDGSGFGRYVTIALISLLVALIVARIVIVVLSARELGNPASRPASARARDARAEAEGLAAAGRFTEAAHALLLALLTTLADRGEVRLHESKTTGEYARELDRNQSPLRAAFRSFRRRYDRVIYGVGECTADDFAALRRDAEPALG
jgi:hypothetical protein